MREMRASRLRFARACRPSSDRLAQRRGPTPIPWVGPRLSLRTKGAMNKTALLIRQPASSSSIGAEEALGDRLVAAFLGR